MIYRAHSTTDDEDLVEISGQNPTVCEKCAKYVGRVYSLSGLDKRYPKFPAFIAAPQYEREHQFCNIAIAPYYGGSILVKHCGEMHIRIPPEKVIAYSSRPFTDERTQKDIAHFEKVKRKKQGTLL